MTARDVLDAIADELGMSFVSRPLNERALFDLVMDRLRSVNRHDLADCIEAIDKASAAGKL